jgi:Ankyrin repeats (3 copies)
MKRELPATLVRLGIPAIVGVWLLALRLVWEQTVWTWERGPQMVGFSLMHSGLGGLLVLAVYASLLWPLVALIFVVIRRNLGGKKLVTMLAVYAVGWVLLTTPYGFWQRLFISKFTPSQAAELMTYAAARGDLRTVRAFLEAGTPVNVQARSGTALHTAAVQAELEVMQYLLSRGAEVNAINAYGDSPMANAREARVRSAEAQALIAKHGGQLVQGTKEQRDRVIGQQVREDIERMEKDMPK